MVRILYGVCGEGGGHASRSKEVISYLRKKGHKVVCIAYGKSYELLHKYVKCYKISGLNISFKNNEADYVQTVIDNLKTLPDRIEHLKNLSSFIEKFKPQLAISDFEPMTVTLANLHDIPLISIDNQHRITNAQIEVPEKYNGARIVADTIIRATVSNTKACLVISFHPVKLTAPKTFIFPPILRSDILKLNPEKKNYILVYQTSETNKQMIEELKKVNENFIIYGFNLSKKEKNLVFKKRNEKGFIEDLKNCKAVITNGGFTLMTEALYLGKPVLSIPIIGQFEQILNAVYLEKLGYGKFAEKLDIKNLRNFLKNIKEYETNLKKYKREDNHRILNMLDELIEQYAIK
jgi:uncharacterized protein (TIGR00661 family)